MKRFLGKFPEVVAVYSELDGVELALILTRADESSSAWAYCGGGGGEENTQHQVGRKEMSLQRRRVFQRLWIDGVKP